MRAWPTPNLPVIPGEPISLRLHDVARGEVAPVEAADPARLYVCGVTPYDTTHMGHAATYVTFDLVGRALRDGGRAVTYVQNVTDVDDPLFERAARDGVDWRDLGQDQIALFLEDMTALGVIPPEHFMGVMESMPVIIDAVQGLVDRGVTYEVVEDGIRDTYLDLAAAGGLGELSHLSRETMLEFSAERGGDPQRTGKRDPLDPMLWRGERDGEPAWDAGALGRGRPGWHIECTAIAMEHLGDRIDVQGGGTDLVFPHHEMSVVQAEALTGERPFAAHTTHQAMVAYDGEKMSKSKGNLVRVSTLRGQGVDPMAIRLVLLAHHYRGEWEWTDADLTTAQERLARWRSGLSTDGGPDASEAVAAVRAALADDLDTPTALAAVDAWAERSLSSGGDVRSAPGELARAIDALLGIRL
ncbi:cysteine--1-D-myo-inosityl 2-amino-2-deoxy-alpha-D-glucopyranoside ligase [Janibacter sp. Soil728]|uniref:cysteine--1-D-myo-inosityl 2-amino-2-deoxy-alpha-D-glucopyranoside ligase n=1 Tax=Janibacter sp. Soil728 TaxID=1736393 RepID=UPI0006F28C26|nr:cysteine--1-D-myo-inosityl 2-amino-2-deoxy-alpha-D-glucopyranoside ligase [Janibacter sp. Soil728]KRE36947.1 cysteine--1-D-myo-inosityl 2-amino-2-deoxy-alpha-D-glucopyranoside ligase [Janibacter sp. Soil728]